MSHDLSLKEMQKAWHGTLRAYLIGIVSCLFLTVISFSIVGFNLLQGWDAIFAIAALAVMQAALQLRYFLHLGEEGSPYWETFVFCFMLVILLVIVIGSLWVMNDLNMRTMTMHHD